MLRLIFFILLFNFYSVLLAQNNYALSKAFTTKDGLPSNHIYKCVEDNRGFLWVATDAGIARFDGKHFQNFTTQQGLPDNEVLSVFKENNGTIWVICFNQHPAYFDEVKNRFINSNEDSSLQKIKGLQMMYGYPLKDGGVMFYSDYGSFTIKDKKVTEFTNYRNEYYFLIKENKNGTQLKWGLNFLDTVLKKSISQIVLLKENKVIDSFQLFKFNKYIIIVPAIDDDKIYLFSPFTKKCFIYTDVSDNHIRFTVDSIDVPDNYFAFGFTKSYLNIYCISGKICVYNKNTLLQQFIMSGNYAPNSMYNDSRGNIWVCTIDKGLILYKQNQLQQVQLPDEFKNTNFLSIARKPNGVLLAGNYNGEIIETDRRKFIIHTSLKNGQTILRQRKIILSQNKVFSFSELGIFINYTKQITSKKADLIYAKNAIVFNDSIIIIAQFNGLNKLNTITNEVTKLFVLNKRITALTKAKDGSIYLGSIDGLYKYDYNKNIQLPLLQNNPLLKERVIGLSLTNDSILWMATSGNGIVAIKGDKVLLHLTEKQGIVNNSTRCIASVKQEQVWVGTVGGLSKIDYKLQGNNIIYSVQNLSVNDGLSSNIFNDLLYQNDSVYAATANGISIIPTNISIPKFNIPIHLIGVIINQRDAIISTKYNLNYQQQNIQLQFAAIELSGHFKNLQYAINNNEEWITLNENLLSLQLNDGNHIVQIRAVDVNGNVGTEILTLQFKIATPFWKAIWFWLLNATLAFATIFYLVQKRNKQKQQQLLAAIENQHRITEIEMQAIKAQINPHFVFNCLNSIKSLNYQKRYVEADNYTDKFSLLLRSTLTFSSEAKISLQDELDYIVNYIQLEQLRFGDKLQFDLKVDASVITTAIQVPALILQPYVENAIRHGIGNLVKGNGLLFISIHQQNDYLKIIIDDNGVGIEKAMMINQSKPDYHQSKGMELNKRRAELHNIILIIEDKKNNETGTRITLKIPLT